MKPPAFFSTLTFQPLLNPNEHTRRRQPRFSISSLLSLFRFSSVTVSQHFPPTSVLPPSSGNKPELTTTQTTSASVQLGVVERAATFLSGQERRSKQQRTFSTPSPVFSSRVRPHLSNPSFFMFAHQNTLCHRNIWIHLVLEKSDVFQNM